MALAQDLDPNRLLPSPPGVGDAAPAAVFATLGVFTGFSPEVPGAKDPIRIVPWDHEESGSDMDDFDDEDDAYDDDDGEDYDAYYAVNTPSNESSSDDDEETPPRQEVA